MSTRIVLVGYGQMGRELHKAAEAAGCEIVGIHDVESPFADRDTAYDVAIEFTEPSSVIQNVKIAAEHGRNIVIGTTGWYDHLGEVRAIQEKAGIGVLYGSNFSIGVQMFFRLVEEAGRLVNNVEDYDAMLHEYHHRRKKDSPSGTAHTAAERLLGAIDRKTHVTTEAQHDQIDANALHVSSTRGGDVIGDHTVCFAADGERVEITHKASGRQIYAAGAVRAALWTKGRGPGFYSMNDVLGIKI